jgi:lia operon protein LiaF
MKRGFLGFILITLGTVFLLVELGVIQQGYREIFVTYWPAIFLLIALRELYKFTRSLFSRGRVRMTKLLTTAMFSAIGIIMIGNRAEWFAQEISLWNFLWPMFVIYIGLKIIFKPKFTVVIDGTEQEVSGEVFTRPRKHYRVKERSGRSENGIRFSERSAFLGEVHLGKNPWALEDTVVNVSIGEIEVDLSKALINEGETNIELTGWIGSCTVKVPEDLAVNVRTDLRLGEIEVFDEKQSGTPGGISYRSANYDEAIKKVNIMVGYSIGEIKVKRVY